MRSRRKFAVVAAFVVLVGAICFVVDQRQRPAISVIQIAYRKLLGGRLMVDFEIVNSGKTSIQFHRSHYLLLRTEGAEGWTNSPAVSPGILERPIFARPVNIPTAVMNRIGYELPIILPPGTRATGRVELPAHIRRWRIGYAVTQPIKQQRVSAKIIGKARDRFYRYFPRAFAEGPPSSEQVWAQTFDAEAWLLANADAPVYMEIPFGAMFGDPARR